MKNNGQDLTRFMHPLTDWNALVSRTLVGTDVQERAIRRTNKLSLGCLCFAFLLAGFAAPSLHAAVSPRYAYVVDSNGSQILEYSITASTGALVALGCPFITTGVGTVPQTDIINQAGTFLFVANAGVGFNIAVFPINPATGCLVPATSYTTSMSPIIIATAAFDSFLYATEGSGNTAQIEGFSVNPTTGALTSIGTWAAANVSGLVVDTAGPYVYAGNNVAAGGIYGFSYNPSTGALVPMAGSPFASVATPFLLALDPVVGFLFVTSPSTNEVASYPITVGTGALGAITNTLPTGPNPWGVAVSPFGQVAYVTNLNSHNVSSYLVTPGTGALAANGPLKVTKPNPTGLTIDQTRTFLYVTDASGAVNGYKISATTGRLTPIVGSPWLTGAGSSPVWVAIYP